MAAYAEPFDVEKMATDRPMREEARCTPVQMATGQENQEILKEPLEVSIPQAGDTPDKCATLPVSDQILTLK